MLVNRKRKAQLHHHYNMMILHTIRPIKFEVFFQDY
jgi:hypothetical protein